MTPEKFIHLAFSVHLEILLSSIAQTLERGLGPRGRGRRDNGHCLSWMWNCPPHLRDGPHRGGLGRWRRNPPSRRPARLHRVSTASCQPQPSPFSFYISSTFSSLKPLLSASFHAQILPFLLAGFFQRACPGHHGVL